MKYIDVDKIRSEIERLYDEEAPKHDQQCNFDDGYFTGLAVISKFIDSLKQEQSEIDLNEEIYFWIKGGGLIYPMSNKEENNIKDTANHFYELGLNIGLNTIKVE